MANGNSTKILVVDNSESTCDCMRALYNESGYDCVRINDGDCCDTALLDDLPELVIVDMTLPRVHAPETLQKIRKNERLKNIPILMISRHGTPRDKMMGYACGANSFITKPIEKKALLREIARMISYKQKAEKQ